MAAFSISLDAANRMDAEAFVAAFGDVAEHSPWVAERAARARPYGDRRAMMEAFLDAILDATPAEQLALVRAHPDLAGRAAIAGQLAEESRREQAGAGLDRLSAEEFKRFTSLNNTYRERFQFPFVLAVRRVDKHGILNAFAKRIRSDPEAELKTAITQIGRIIAFRLEDRVQP